MAHEKANSSNKSDRHKTSTVAATANKGKTMLQSYKSFYKSLKRTPIVGALLAEFIGTFLLVASVFAVQGQPLFVAFALIGAVLVVGGVSGAHLNPAMTIGSWASRKISSLYAFGYVLAQVLGAIAAWLVLVTFLRGSETTAASSSPALFHAATMTTGKEWYVFFTELLGATILAFGFATALRFRKDKVTAAFSYGFAALIALIVAGSITSMFLTESNTGLTFLNPAAAIAANGLSWNLWPISIYILAPVIGGIVGFVLQDFLHSQSDDCACEDCK